MTKEQVKIDYKLDTFYYLSTEGFKFKYRLDRYDRFITHVELFNQSGQVIHKEMAHSLRYNISKSHHQIINSLEARITLNELDPTGLKQEITCS